MYTTDNRLMLITEYGSDVYRPAYCEIVVKAFEDGILDKSLLCEGPEESIELLTRLDIETRVLERMLETDQEEIPEEFKKFTTRPCLEAHMSQQGEIDPHMIKSVCDTAEESGVTKAIPLWESLSAFVDEPPVNG